MPPIPEPSIPKSTPTGVRAVLLDWDNTLHDSASVNFAALRTVLSRIGLEVDQAAYRAAYTTDYRLLYRRLGLAEDRIEEASKSWRALVASREPRLLAGAEDAVRRLAAAGLRLGLVTTGREAIVRRQLERVGIAPLFSAMSFGDGQPRRPDPAPLREVLGRLRVPPPQAVLCSDGLEDMRMARAAGVWVVGIATFAFSEAALHEAGANETASSLASWVDRWLGKRPSAGR